MEIQISPIENAIEDLKKGKMIILVDSEDRENEGDLVIAAEFATPEAINFMATYGKGLICVPMESDRIKELQLEPMVKDNTEKYRTAFTVSVDASSKHGVTTGISAYDRAKTVQVLIDPNTTSEDLVKPGHIFPLQAVPGGVIRRAGHTEASVDLCKLAGLKPAAVICEIMNDDGTMARLPQLMEFAKKTSTKHLYNRRFDSLSFKNRFFNQIRV
jgi:3,4-dihydroxy 2-butanone 4-phosphate synthase/GTP cyclohydrolase II